MICVLVHDGLASFLNCRSWRRCDLAQLRRRGNAWRGTSPDGLLNCRSWSRCQNLGLTLMSVLLHDGLVRLNDARHDKSRWTNCLKAGLESGSLRVRRCAGCLCRVLLHLRGLFLRGGRVDLDPMAGCLIEKICGYLDLACLVAQMYDRFIVALVRDHAFLLHLGKDLDCLLPSTGPLQCAYYGVVGRFVGVHGHAVQDLQGFPPLVASRTSAQDSAIRDEVRLQPTAANFLEDSENWVELAGLGASADGSTVCVPVGH
mmetsp:Transcript_11136/g.19479  ORF Transcript_11136/g.19479 Transcript_11136/m.19479 type:complete len:259 (-) Transcript_11136:111-887(-)